MDMDNNMDKKIAFEYFLFELMNWNIEAKRLTSFDERNDLSILKSLKLLFFTVAIDSKNPESLLENTFDNFHAMPLGHVELDIYNQYKNLDSFSLDRSSLQMKNKSWEDITTYFHSTFIDKKSNIKKAVTHLKQVKSSLILESAFDLVELSHTWNSWISTFNSSHSKRSYIHHDLIRNDFQNFEIQSF